MVKMGEGNQLCAVPIVVSRSAWVGLVLTSECASPGNTDHDLIAAQRSGISKLSYITREE